MIVRSTLDLISGSLVALTSDFLFNNSWDIALAGKNERLEDSKILLMKSSRVWIQMVMTVLSAYEVRNLYTFPDTVDPLGGMMFMMPLGMLMPGFWKKVSDLFNILKNNLLTDEIENSSSNSNE